MAPVNSARAARSTPPEVFPLTLVRLQKRALVVAFHTFVAVRSPRSLSLSLAQADVHTGRVFHSAHSFLGR